MKFDKITYHECPTGPPPPPPPPTEPPATIDCSDEFTALLNPDKCGETIKYVVKPEFIHVPNNTYVNYRFFESHNEYEKEIEDGVEWLTLACNGIIGSHTGTFLVLAADVIGSQEIITARYKGVNVNATIKMTDLRKEVTASNYILIDNSKSMSLEFGNGLRKIDVAKILASNYLTTFSEKSVLRDSIVSFNNIAKLEARYDVPLQDRIEKLNAIEVADRKTNITDAINYIRGNHPFAPIELPGDTHTNLLIFTDGEDPDLKSLRGAISSFNYSCGNIAVIGIRAHTKYFTVLKSCVRPGYFVNVINLDDSFEEANNFLKTFQYYYRYDCLFLEESKRNNNEIPSASEGEICLNCQPDKWTTINGTVFNLIGKGRKCRWQDILPGNGLYAEIRGVTPSVDGGMYKIFDSVPNKKYYIKITVAGNNREKRFYDDTLYVGIDPYDGNFIFGSFQYQHREKISYFSDFTDYIYEYPASSDKFVVGITVIINDRKETKCGLLIDKIRIYDEDGTTIFFDNFDNNNRKTGDYNCYELTGNSLNDFPEFKNPAWDYNCDITPVGPQKADPNPLPDIESNIITPVYNSTVSLDCRTIVSDVEGLGDNYFEIATASSIVSQEEADRLAAEAAKQKCLDRDDALNWQYLQEGDLMNINFSNFKNSDMRGEAFLGYSAEDYWNNIRLNFSSEEGYLFSRRRLRTTTNKLVQPYIQIAFKAVNVYDSIEDSPRLFITSVLPKYIKFSPLPYGKYLFYVYIQNKPDYDNGLLYVSNLAQGSLEHPTGANPASIQYQYFIDLRGRGHDEGENYIENKNVFGFLFTCRPSGFASICINMDVYNHDYTQQILEHITDPELIDLVQRRCYIAGMQLMYLGMPDDDYINRPNNGNPFIDINTWCSDDSCSDNSVYNGGTGGGDDGGPYDPYYGYYYNDYYYYDSDGDGYIDTSTPYGGGGGGPYDPYYGYEYGGFYYYDSDGDGYIDNYYNYS